MTDLSISQSTLQDSLFCRRSDICHFLNMAKGKPRLEPGHSQLYFASQL